MFDETREETERLKFYDSNKKYLDYIFVETLDEWANFSGRPVEEEYKSVIAACEKINSIEELLLFFCIDYTLISNDWHYVVSFMHPFFDEYSSEEELLTNEWVNKIGDYYVVIGKN